MTVWPHLTSVFVKQHILRKLCLALMVVVITTALFLTHSTQAAPNVTKTISFQGRLLSASGAVVPDGYYNMQFKIYEGGSGNQAGNPDGTHRWTETYVNNGGNNGIRVKNGVFSVNLGSVTAFGTSVDWNHETLWLSMNVAGNSSSCTIFGNSPCQADGEMLPMKKISATPYALNAGQLGGKTADDFLQKTGDLQAGSIHIADSIQSNTSLLAPSVDTQSAGSLSIGTVNATEISIGQVNSNTTINGRLSTSSIDSLPGSSDDGDGEVITEPTPSDWEEKTGSGIRNWRSIAASGDGSNLVAAEAGGYIYTSSDSGETWQQTASGVRDWRSVTSSADGTKLVATVWDGYIYTSINSGATWQQRTASGSRNWTFAATSSDGSKIIASVLAGHLYYSDDSGSTWSQLSSLGTNQWESVASSADGAKLAAVSSNGYIYTSTDSGANWSEHTTAGSRSWSSVAMSADGTKLAAAALGGYIYLSQDSGQTWQQATSVGSRNWRSVTSSADGTRLAAAALDNYIYTSTNSGLSWTEGTSAGTSNWVAVASSADGSTLAATASGNYIYTLRSSPTQQPPTQSGSILSIGSTNASQIIIGGSQATTKIQGSVNVTGPSTFGGSINLQTNTNSSEAFNIQNSSGERLLNVNTSSNNVSIGQIDGKATLLVLDTKNTEGDPTGTNGAMYYNSSAGKFRCYESGTWKDCITPLPISKVAETDTSNTTTTPIDVDDLSFILSPNTKYYYKFVILHEAANSTTGVGFGVTTPNNPIMNNWCINTTATVTSPTPGHWGSYCGVGDASATTDGSANLGTTYTSTMEGYIQTDGDAGDLKLRMVSESTNQTTVKKGSFGILQIVQ